MLSGEDYEEIYRLTDAVSPVPFDCGQICGAACCRAGEQAEAPEEVGIWLLPGEAALHRGGRSTLRIRTGADTDMEARGFCFAQCVDPDHCVRSLRPIQCRSFPLWPQIGRDGRLVLLWNEMELPYACPLLESRAALDGAFCRVMQEAWERLAAEPEIRRFVRETAPRKF